MESDAALPRAPPGRVLHAITGKDVEVTVVHGHGQRDDERALGLLKVPMHPGVEVERFRGPVELG